MEKYENDTISVNDTPLFFKTLFGYIYRSKAGDPDEEIHELWENIQTDIEEFGSMIFFIEIWGSNINIVFSIDKDRDIKVLKLSNLSLFDK